MSGPGGLRRSVELLAAEGPLTETADPSVRRDERRDRGWSRRAESPSAGVEQSGGMDRPCGSAR
jgi:hypothetical protein